MRKVDTLIISDIHLGSKDCNAKALLEFLQGCSFERLIIAGDLIEDDSTISDEQMKLVLYLIERIQKIKYVDGNHDPKEESFLGKLIGRLVHQLRKLRKRSLESYEWTMAGKRFCVVHGHRFDKICFIFSEPLIDRMFLNFAWILRIINIKGFNLEKWLDTIHSNFSQSVAKKARKFARKHKADVIICGHTHQAMHKSFLEKNGNTIEYYNCGCWVGEGNPCSYITIDEQGTVELHTMTPE